MENKQFEKRNKPEMESFYTLSADGKWIIHKTVITDIKSINYLDVILHGKTKKLDENLQIIEERIN